MKTQGGGGGSRRRGKSLVKCNGEQPSRRDRENQELSRRLRARKTDLDLVRASPRRSAENINARTKRPDTRSCIRDRLHELRRSDRDHPASTQFQLFILPLNQVIWRLAYRRVDTAV